MVEPTRFFFLPFFFREFEQLISVDRGVADGVPTELIMKKRGVFGCFFHGVIP